ncbi:hypothetical protein A8A54_19035 [Brucella pseudogrignonensis]|uniref:LamB/YcsF family protein n=1 Tax=Brucella pseudogrignonensis TaxID=419475 RepID=UPI0007DA81F7|nr:5-oxoprolinase subunit PxpA [Brucella pseudogrignonensis]ANG98704.1 hypothetical protein A8A54_19035 [Brucella pseudogrignonensis]
MTTYIDINADMAEGFGAYKIGNDPAMLDIITTGNIACGMHGGDPVIMARICAQAREKGVAIGAHPGVPDLWNFGRRHMDLTRQEVRDFVAYQMGALEGAARLSGHRPTHVKTHGALGHYTGDTEHAAQGLIDAVKAYDSDLIIMVMVGTMLEDMAEAAGLRVAREIFADRTYEDNGRIMSRTKPGSMVTDAQQAADSISAMVASGQVIAVSGKRIAAKGIDSVCTHGDTANSVAIAQAVRDRLIADGCVVQPFVRTMNG